jgi:hypothetical protein
MLLQMVDTWNRLAEDRKIGSAGSSGASRSIKRSMAPAAMRGPHRQLDAQSTSIGASSRLIANAGAWPRAHLGLTSIQRCILSWVSALPGTILKPEIAKRRLQSRPSRSR